MTRLTSLLAAAGVAPRAHAGPDPVIAAAVLDSRRVRSGDAFFALPGGRADGLDYVRDALGRGARAVVAAVPPPAGLAPDVAWIQVDDPRHAVALVARECEGRPDEALALVGVTGTNGKTTVAFLVESIARAAGHRAGRIGTIGSAIDGRSVEHDRTTPEAPDFFALLSEMVQSGVEIAAVEVSSHALALHRVAGARFRVAAFLNLGSDHLDFHGDRASYFEAKARLFDELGSGASAVLPADAPEGDVLARRTRARILRFGRDARSDVRLRDERTDLSGSSAVLDTPSGPVPVRTFLPGRHNLDNVAAAAACATSLGLSAEAIATGVLACERVPGRMERVATGQPFDVLVDFAHTPAALEALLGWLRSAAAGRVLVVFGCGGERDRAKRPEMGRIAATAADLAFLTSDNPRGEDPERILDDVERGARQAPDAASRVRRIADRGEAIRAAIDEAASGDVVVIAGKGHETTQSAGGRTLPFDDRLVATEALEARGWKRRA
jgi:UDP-N-acetylmuramoyl-L-alanyl-D-glutamate--2,6-diaminopimelate ligase